MTDTHPTSRLRNLAAAFALAATDDMWSAIETDSAMIAGAPAALATIFAFPGGSLDTLRTILRLTPSGAGRSVDRLVAEGLVEPGRERCDHICRLCDINACPQDICPVETAAVANEPDLTHGHQRRATPASIMIIGRRAATRDRSSD